jgi:hypothetical protein
MDITGFDEQIGATFAKGIKNMVKKTASKITPKVVVKKPLSPLKKMVAVKPSALIQRAQAAVKKAAPMPTKMVAVNPSVLQRMQQVPTSLPKKRKVVKSTPIFSTDKKRIKAKRQVVTTQRVLPSVTRLAPQNQIMVVRSQPVTPQTMAVLNPVQRSFTKADLPYRPVVKSNPIVRIKNTPISYSTSIDMIEPSVDAGASNYYGK